MYDKNGNEAVLSELLKKVKNKCRDFYLYYMNFNKELCPIRFCAARKTKEEMEFEQKNLRKKESKKQVKISEETKFSHNYFFVITSLDDSFSAEEILDLYRLHWQVEMVFKRLKSILNLESMPTKTAASSEVWLNCKMLIALLIEKLMLSIDFSPMNSMRSLWRETKTLYHLIFNCFFNIQRFDFKKDFLAIVSNCCVEKRKNGARLQMFGSTLG